MKQKITKLICLLGFVLCFITADAQKKITPVDNDPEKPTQPVLHYYDKHGNPLEEPVLFLADLDTVTNVKSAPVYPLLYSANVGFNFFDAIMMLAGQKHGSFDLQASLSLHNWFEPVVELGLGFAHNNPEDGNFNYKGKPSFYGKIGINYNFLYKGNPDYQLFLGLRAGFSRICYDITDITINSDYWGQSNEFSLLNQRATSFYGQALLGIRIKIWREIFMGWNIRYGFKFNNPVAQNSNPWFIPGYGTSPLSFSFSVYYCLPLSKNKNTLTNRISTKLNEAAPPQVGDAVAVP